MPEVKVCVAMFPLKALEKDLFQAFLQASGDCLVVAVGCSSVFTWSYPYIQMSFFIKMTVMLD